MEVGKGLVVQRNVIANAIGGSWIVLLNLISIPVQIRLLGAEAYGLIGFVISLQAFLMIVDFGLSTTVVREIASDESGNHFDSRNLIQTAGSVYWLVGFLVTIAVIMGANWLVDQWFTFNELSNAQASEALRILAIWLFFSWPFILYTSILTGLQRLDIVNTLRVVSQTIGQGGGILILLLTRNLQYFLTWLAVIAALSTLAAMFITKKHVPSISFWPNISRLVIAKIWRFSLDINLITIMAILFTQTDRLLISRLLPTSRLGHYNAAYNISRGVAVIQGFFNSAVLPLFASDHASGSFNRLKDHYHRYSQALVYAVTLPSLILIFFGGIVLRIWVSETTAIIAGRTITILGIGFLLNAVMSAAYSLSIATGYTRIPLKVNLMGIGIYLPGLYLLILNYGIEGAAIAWCVLNIYYFLTLLPLTQKIILKSTSFEWIKTNVLPFFLIGTLIFAGAKEIVVFQPNLNSLGTLMIIILAVLLYLSVGFFFLNDRTRKQAQQIPTQIVASMRSTLFNRKP